MHVFIWKRLCPKLCARPAWPRYQMWSAPHFQQQVRLHQLKHGPLHWLHAGDAQIKQGMRRRSYGNRSVDEAGGAGSGVLRALLMSVPLNPVSHRCSSGPAEFTRDYIIDSAAPIGGLSAPRFLISFWGGTQFMLLFILLKSTKCYYLFFLFFFFTFPLQASWKHFALGICSSVSQLVIEIIPFC